MIRQILSAGVVFLLVSGIVIAEQQPAKEAKDEVLYKGKPAGFWIKQLKDRDASFRLDAVKALRAIGTDGEGVVLALVQALADKEPGVKNAAHEAMASLPLENRIPALSQVLQGKENAARATALVLLGEIGSAAKDALPEVSKALGDKDSSIRSKAAAAVGKIGVPEKAALAGLTKLVADKENSVRLEAIKALGKIEKDTEIAIPSLLERLSPEREEDAATRLQAVRTLCFVGKQDEKVLSAILLACGDPDGATSKEARAAITRVEVKKRVVLLSAALKKDKNADIRAYAVRELDEIGPDARDAVPALILLLDEKALAVPAAKALGKIGLNAKDAIPNLAKLLDEHDEALQLAALAALRNLGPDAKVVVLTRSLIDKNAEVRLQAATDLAGLGSKAKEAVPALARALDDSDSPVSDKVALALAAIGKESVPSLIEYLKGMGKNRAAAARALGQIGPDAKAAIPILAKLINESDETLQSAATTALRLVGPDARVPALIGSLKDKDWQVRVRSAKELGILGKEARSALPALLDAFAADHAAFQRRLVPHDPFIRQVHEPYETALQRIGRHDVPQLIEILKKSKDRAAENAQSQIIYVMVAAALAEIGLPDAQEAIPVLIQHCQVGKVWVPAGLALGRLSGPDETKVAVPALLEVFAGFENPARTEFEAANNYFKAKSRSEAVARKQDRDNRPRLNEEVERIQRRFEVIDKQYDLLKLVESADHPLMRQWRENQHVRLMALTAIGNLDKNAVPSLIEILKGDNKRKPVTGIALEPLAALALVELFPNDAKDAHPIFAGLLRSTKIHRGVYAYALGKVGGKDAKEAIPMLVHLLGENEDVVKEEAAAILKAMGKDAVTDLTALLQEKDAPKTLVIGALGEIGPAARSAIPVLRKCLQEEDHREAAAFALGMIGGPDAIPILMTSLKDADPHRRIAAATALGPTGKDAVAPLLEFLKGKEDNRVLAVYALGEIGPDAKAALPLLVRLLDDEDKILRMTAATALGKLGKDAVLPLIDYLKRDLLDGQSDNRVLAIYALGKIGPDAKEAIPILRSQNKARKAVDVKQDEKASREKREDRIEKAGALFLNPRLLKIKTHDRLLEADLEEDIALQLSLLQIAGETEWLLVKRQEKARQDRAKANRRNRSGEGKDEARDAKVARKSVVGPPFGEVLQALRRERIADEEKFDEEALSEARNKEAENDLLVKSAMDNALLQIGKKAVPTLKASLRSGDVSLSRAIVLARVSPADAEDLQLSWSERRSHEREIGRIMDAQLKELAPFKSLVGLNLDRAKVTDVGMKVVGTFTKLSTLSLDSTDITDIGLKELARLGSLTTLEVGGTKVTDWGLKEVAKLKNLSLLDLGGTRLTDAGLTEVSKLPNLSSLGLAHTDITDLAVKQLAGMKSLTLLDLRGTQVSEAAIAQLRTALPKAVIRK